MTLRPIRDNSFESLQQLVQDLNGELRGLKARNNAGQRSVNASAAVAPDDHVIKAQLDLEAAKVRKIEEKLRRQSRPRQTVPVGTAAGTLPPPNHPIDFAYYFVKSYYDEVKAYTSGYWCGSTEDETDPPPPASVWQQTMAERLRKAAGDNKGINIEWEYSWPPADTALTLEAIELAGFDEVWPKIHRMIFADEPGESKSTLEAWCADIRQQIAAYNLPMPPGGLGISMTKKQLTESDRASASGIDFVGIECYVDPPGDENAQVNVDAMVAWIRQAKTLVPAGKKITLIMQAYNRNGRWEDEGTLAALQIPVYMEAYNDPRVTEILMFAYDRAGAAPPGGVPSKGSRQLGSVLTDLHKQIGAAIMGITVPQDGCNKLATGGILAEDYVSRMDTIIAENQDILEYINGIVHVIEGQQAAFKAKCVEAFNVPEFGLECEGDLPVPPYEAPTLLLKRANGTEFSEAYSVYASDRRVRFTGNSYLTTCRPAEF